MEWGGDLSPLKNYSVVGESFYNGNEPKGYLRGIDHSQSIEMLLSGQVQEEKFKGTDILNIETPYGCTGACLMPFNSEHGDHLVNAVEMNSSGRDIKSINVLAGGEDGSVILSEMVIPRNFQSSRESRNKHNYDNNSEKVKESVDLHRDAVTSIQQRPEYPSQYLSTGLDGQALLYLLLNSLEGQEMITEFSQLFSTYNNGPYEEAIGDAAWMDSNGFIAKSEATGTLVLQDVREGQGTPSQHLFSTPSGGRINDFDLNPPFMALSCDDGNLSILDLRCIKIDRSNDLVPLFNVYKPGESGMGIKMLKDTTRVYGVYTKSGIYGYSFQDDDLAHDGGEWQGEFDSEKYGIPKKLHIVHHEKKDNGEVYCQDVIVVSTNNGLYTYGLANEDEA